MTPDAIEALSFFFGIAATAWAAAYAWGKWLTHRHDAAQLIPPATTPAVDLERMTRLEVAVEALSVELERIGEAQRYAIKLLDERLPRGIAAPASQPVESGRAITPH